MPASKRNPEEDKSINPIESNRTRDTKRPSVFSRLGTKGATPAATASATPAFAKNKFGGQLKKRPVDRKEGAKKGSKSSPAIDPDWETWDEKNLDYDDELMLEKKRQMLQRELQKQVKKPTPTAKPRSDSSDSSSESSSGSSSGSSRRSQKGKGVKRKVRGSSSSSGHEGKGKKKVRTKLAKKGKKKKATLKSMRGELKKVKKGIKAVTKARRQSLSPDRHGNPRSSQKSDNPKPATTTSSTVVPLKQERDKFGFYCTPQVKVEPPKPQRQTTPIDRDHRSPVRQRGRNRSKSPRGRHSRSPRGRQSRSPRGRQSRSPRGRQSRSPRARQSRSPRTRQSRSPRPRHSRSPRARQSRSPRARYSRSPRPIRRSKSPRGRLSRSPRPSASKMPRKSPHTPPKKGSYDDRGKRRESPKGHTRSNSRSRGHPSTSNRRDLSPPPKSKRSSPPSPRPRGKGESSHDSKRRGERERYDERSSYSRDSSHRPDDNRYLQSNRPDNPQKGGNRSGQGYQGGRMLEQRGQGRERSFEKGQRREPDVERRGSGAGWGDDYRERDRNLQPGRGFDRKNERDEWMDNREYSGRRKDEWESGDTAWRRDKGPSPATREPRGGYNARGRDSRMPPSARMDQDRDFDLGEFRGRGDWGDRRRSPSVRKGSLSMGHHSRSMSKERLLPPFDGGRSTPLQREIIDESRLLPRSRTSRERSDEREDVKRKYDDVRGMEELDDKKDTGDKRKRHTNEEEGEVADDQPSSKKQRIEPAAEPPPDLTDAFSDFGESDEEILCKDVLNEGEIEEEKEEGETLEEEEEGEMKKEDEEEEGEATSSRSSSRRSHTTDLDLDGKDRRKKADGILEGITDEDLEEVSEEEEEKEAKSAKAKMADALGVDWGQLMSLGKDAKPEASKGSSLQEKWSTAAMLKRYGLAKEFLSEKAYDSIIENANNGIEDETKLFKPVHPVALIDVGRRKRAEERTRLFGHKVGPQTTALTTRKDMKIRNFICGSRFNTFSGLFVPGNLDLSEWQNDALNNFKAKRIDC